MRRSRIHPTVLPLVALLLLAPAVAAAAPSKGYDTLVALFQEWRSFQQPRIVDGVPDYGPAAMRAQAEALPALQRRLEAIDTSGWSVPEQVDLRIVRAEMNGLAFDHRVLRPWAENPAFYLTVMPEQSDQPAPEGPKAAILVDLWRCTFPVSGAQAEEIRPGLRAIPGLLAQARTNLVGNRRDLWVYSADAIQEQADALRGFAGRLDGPANASLREDVLRAQRATASYRSWVAEQAKAKTGPSGVGVANYDWYLKHVQLLPYGWRDEVVLLERELARARSLLAMEEQRNRGLPELTPVATADEHARAFADAVPRYMAFLSAQDVMTIPDFFAPALQARIGAFSPGPRNFFLEVDYREPLALRTHGYHWFDLAWMEHRPHPSPIRRGALLYNIFASRTEGHATGWEEQMLQLGLFDARPRARELVYVLLAQRAARGLASLRMQANEFTLEQAARWAAAETPRGWLRLDDGLVWGEQFLYLQQPNYGTSYVVGKVEMERLLAAWKARRGADFRLRDYMDALNGAGLVPTSLLLWEMTGTDPSAIEGASVEAPLSVSGKPAPARTAGGTLLVYELYVGGYDSQRRVASRVEVRRDGPDGAVLRSYEGDELARVLVPPRKGWVDAATILVGVSLAEGAPLPATLHHTVFFADGSVYRGGVASVATAAAVEIAPPVRGSGWLATNGPTTEPVYHRNAFFTFNGVNYLSERFAIDFLRLGPDGRVAARDGSRNEDWYCYGSELVAVADGTVVDARDGVPENLPGGRAIPMTVANLGGNYVLLDVGDRHDRFALYAHAIPGSLKVKIGDRVKAGQVLAKLGNSGNSDAPHLHFHVCDGTGPLGRVDEGLFCDGLPFRLSGFRLLGTVPPGFLGSLTTWTPSGPPQARTDEMVARDQVLDLGP